MRVYVICTAFILLLGAGAVRAAAQSNTCQVTVRVDGFRNQRGELGVNVFRSQDGWPEDNGKAVLHRGYPIPGDHVPVQFELPPGRYAIVVLHDENSNQKLDRNFLGIPKEGFGFANNPKVGLSAPKFDIATLQVSCPTTETSIHLSYK